MSRDKGAPDNDGRPPPGKPTDAADEPSPSSTSPQHQTPGTNRYRLTGDGLRFAIFYTKLHDRLLRPLLATDQPPTPLQI